MISQDMSMQRKDQLFRFLNQEKILPFFKSVEMVRVTQRNMKYFPRIKEEYLSRTCGLLDNTSRDTSSLGFCIERFSVHEIPHLFERSPVLFNNFVCSSTVLELINIGI